MRLMLLKVRAFPMVIPLVALLSACNNTQTEGLAVRSLPISRNVAEAFFVWPITIPCTLPDHRTNPPDWCANPFRSYASLEDFEARAQLLGENGCVAVNGVLVRPGFGPCVPLLASSGVTASPTPTTTASPTPNPSPGASPSPTPSGCPVATPTPTPGTSPTPVPSPSSSPSATPTPAPSSTPTPTPAPTASPAPQGTDLCPNVPVHADLNASTHYMKYMTGNYASYGGALNTVPTMTAGAQFIIRLTVDPGQTTLGTFPAGFAYSDIGPQRGGRNVTISRSKCDYSASALWVSQGMLVEGVPPIPSNAASTSILINETRPVSPGVMQIKIDTGVWYINIKNTVGGCPANSSCDVVVEWLN